MIQMTGKCGDIRVWIQDKGDGWVPAGASAPDVEDRSAFIIAEGVYLILEGGVKFMTLSAGDYVLAYSDSICIISYKRNEDRLEFWHNGKSQTGFELWEGDLDEW